MTTTINASNSGSGGLVQTADASGVLALQTAGTTAVTVDTSQNVGIGTTSPSTYANGFGPVLVAGTGNNFATIQGRTDGPSGSTNGVSYGGSYSTNPINGSRVTFNAEGGSGQRGSVSFWTKALDDNSTQPLERMRIDQSGNVFVGGTTQNTSTNPVYASTTAKAWVNFNGSGGINSSFNVSSVTRTSTGNFDVNFSSAMPNANFAATANSWQSVSNSNVSYNVFNFTTAKYQITTFENGAGTNPNATYSIVFAT